MISLLIVAAVVIGYSTGAHAVEYTVTPPTEYATDPPRPIPDGVAWQWKLYGAKCGQPLQLLSTFTSNRFSRNPGTVGEHCYALTAAILDSATGEPGVESDQSAVFKITVVPAGTVKPDLTVKPQPPLVTEETPPQ